MANETSSSGLPDEHVDWEAVARHLAGESPAGEAEAVRRRLAARPHDAALVAELDRAVRRLTFTPPADLDVEAALRRVRARRDTLDVVPLAPPAGGRTPRNRAIVSPWWRGAAGLAAAMLVVAAGTLLWRRARREPVATPAVAEARVFETRAGRRDSLRLPDGTRVLLGPGSRLTLAPGYGTARREAELGGEAFFDVVHDASRPFTVRVGNATLRDVGTAFSVHGDGARVVRVAVVEGAVELRPGGAGRAGIVLRKGWVGVLGPTGAADARPVALTDDDLAWTRGRLVFREAAMAEVSADLERWYGVVLRMDPSLAGRHVTASFAGEPVDRVLQVIGLALGAAIDRRGDTAVVRPAGPVGGANRP